MPFPNGEYRCFGEWNGKMTRMSKLAVCDLRTLYCELRKGRHELSRV